MLRRSRHGGVRLGRKLLGLWRWALCGRRRRRGGYRRLQQQPGDGTPERAERKLALVLRWGRSLARRLRLLGWRAGGHRMLGDGCGGEQTVTTPKGQVAVYVGGGGEASQWLRYVVPVVYFNHPMFGELLREAEEEFGFQHPGVITIPCPAARFEQAAALAAAGKKGFGRW
ncbi:auxin-responsive protein SAUR36-like [Miscanthus floridulus]|uniref:auxin-responsive protein SAUR36-like n=1 Tax=Miscanthus floridulus TaxID=154761 RepID=UPI00345A2AFE